MTKTDVKVKFTYQDYLRMPEDRRYELVEGEFFMVPSPSEYHQRISKISYRDGEIKRKLYGRYGVKEYWIVDPIKQTIEVLSNDVADYKKTGTYDRNTPLSSPLLSGLSIDLNSVFYEM